MKVFYYALALERENEKKKKKEPIRFSLFCIRDLFIRVSMFRSNTYRI